MGTDKRQAPSLWQHWERSAPLQPFPCAAAAACRRSKREVYLAFIKKKYPKVFLFLSDASLRKYLWVLQLKHTKWSSRQTNVTQSDRMSKLMDAALGLLTRSSSFPSLMSEPEAIVVGFGLIYTHKWGQQRRRALLWWEDCQGLQAYHSWDALTIVDLRSLFTPKKKYIKNRNPLFYFRCSNKQEEHFIFTDDYKQTSNSTWLSQVQMAVLHLT